MADLRALLGAMRAARREPSRFATAQAEFLRAVAEVAGNDVLAGAASTIRSLLQVWVARVPWATADIDAAVVDYGLVVDTIAAGDRIAARAAMSAAIARANEQIRATLEKDERVSGAEGTQGNG
jgi:DNA-binding FadR family transcriptional regulator